MSKKNQVMDKLSESQKKGKEKASKAKEAYKKFAMQGNALDLAIGVVIGGAFSNIVTAILDTTITPLVSILTNKIDLSTLFISLTGETYATLEEAKAAGALTWNYGALLNAILNFFIISLVLFAIVRVINSSKIKEEEEKAKIKTTKECPHCLSTIPIKATKCAFCASDLAEEKKEKKEEKTEEKETKKTTSKKKAKK